MQSQLQAAINQICAEKNIDREIVTEAIENAIGLAYKRDFGTPGQNIKVMLGDDISQMRIFEIRTVVQKVENHEIEIALKDAKLIRPDAAIEQEVYVPLTLQENFGRIAAQTAKHVISQKLQEAEREMLFHKFKDREGDLITARVQKIDRDAVLVEIEGVTTLLFSRNQIPNEKYFTGQRLQVLLEKVELTSKGPQLRITRATTDFIIALFEKEIPELREGLVGVTKIAREAGTRCKIAVSSEESSIDPVGAFVGQRGSRINSVMEEVGDERLDVIQYYDDEKKMLLAALSPAKVAKVEFVNENGEDRIKIHVREEERAVTIGKGGQNVRLAGQLLQKQIDVITFNGPDTEDESLKQAPEKKEKASKREVSEKVTIDQLDGVDKEVIELLSEMGLSQIKQFEGMTPEELTEVGITIEQAKSMMKAINSYLK